ncbi:MAG: hypothetical protein KF799_11195 [Bdellovibrionales bacterium]|nr:hypothetical protein [Bdellovibrionales bacterium]
MAKLVDSDISIPPYLGRPATAKEVYEVEDLVRWLRGRIGILSRLDNGGSEAKVFRWSAGDGDHFVIKAYFDREDAQRSDRQFKLLTSNFPRGLLKIVPVLGRYRALRFYQDIQGVTIEHLFKDERYSQELKSEIRRLYSEHLELLKGQIVRRYGVENVTEFIDKEWNLLLPELHLEVKVSSEIPPLGIWIYEENVLFDSRTKQFWIIDPE